MYIKDYFIKEIKNYFNNYYQYWYQASWTAASAGIGSLFTETLFERGPNNFFANIEDVNLRNWLT